MFVDFQGAVGVGAAEGVGCVDGGRGQSLRHGHPHINAGQMHDERLRGEERRRTTFSVTDHIFTTTFVFCISPLPLLGSKEGRHEGRKTGKDTESKTGRTEVKEGMKVERTAGGVGDTLTMEQQYALGLKSLPSATITPASNMSLALG